MIGKYLDRVRGGLEFGTPFFEASHNSHELFVVYLVDGLGRTMFLRIEGHGVEDSLVIVLGQYSGGDVVMSRRRIGRYYS